LRRGGTPTSGHPVGGDLDDDLAWLIEHECRWTTAPEAAFADSRIAGLTSFHQLIGSGSEATVPGMFRIMV